jgi:endonuclease/exonuclease/phosphatase family metal-dependent hydrolase
MGIRHSKIARLLAALLTALALTVVLAATAGAHGRPGHGHPHGAPAHVQWSHEHRLHGDGPGHHRVGKPLTVMTRNLYLGADITRPLAALQAPPDRQVEALIAANTELRAIVDMTSFPLRAQQLAREIDQRNPDLIGLQEVALWRHGPLDGSPATVVDYDFLQILLDALAARGEHYDVAHVQQESDVSAPAFLGGSLQNVRLTIRDVVLERRHNGVHVVSSSGANYVTRIPLTIAGQTLEFIRGYNVVEVRAGGQQVRFINTHLESQLSDVAYAQAAELLAGPAAPGNGEPTILVCDCNTDPLNATRKPGETHAHQDPYLLLTGPGGFADEWLLFAPAEAGFTSGLSELVNDTPEEAAARFNHRIDFVFGRRADGSPMPVDWAWATGKDPDERTPETPIGRLWPSDHAGVVVRLRP